MYAIEYCNMCLRISTFYHTVLIMTTMYCMLYSSFCVPIIDILNVYIHLIYTYIH